MTDSDEDLHAAAVIAALNGKQAAGYELDDAKALTDIPDGYTEVMVTRRYGAVRRNDGTTGRQGWRIATRQIGSSITNARTMRNRTHQALEFVRLTIGGALTTPIQFEGAEDIGEDGDHYSGLETWTYAI